MTRTDKAGSQQWTAVSEQNSCPMLSSCFIGSCHVGVSKRFHVVSALQFVVEKPRDREHGLGMSVASF